MFVKVLDSFFYRVLGSSLSVCLFLLLRSSLLLCLNLILKVVDLLMSKVIDSGESDNETSNKGETRNESYLLVVLRLLIVKVNGTIIIIETLT